MFEFLLLQVPEIDPITVGWIKAMVFLKLVFYVAFILFAVAVVAYWLGYWIELWWAIQSRRRQRERRRRWPTEDPDEP